MISYQYSLILKTTCMPRFFLLRHCMIKKWICGWITQKSSRIAATQLMVSYEYPLILKDEHPPRFVRSDIARLKMDLWIKIRTKFKNSGQSIGFLWTLAYSYGRVHATFCPFRHYMIKKWIYGLTTPRSSTIVAIQSKFPRYTEKHKGLKKLPTFSTNIAFS